MIILRKNFNSFTKVVLLLGVTMVSGNASQYDRDESHEVCILRRPLKTPEPYLVPPRDDKKEEEKDPYSSPSSKEKDEEKAEDDPLSFQLDDGGHFAVVNAHVRLQKNEASTDDIELLQRSFPIFLHDPDPYGKLSGAMIGKLLADVAASKEEYALATQIIMQLLPHTPDVMLQPVVQKLAELYEKGMDCTSISRSAIRKSVEVSLRTFGSCLVSGGIEMLNAISNKELSKNDPAWIHRQYLSVLENSKTTDDEYKKAVAGFKAFWPKVSSNTARMDDVLAHVEAERSHDLWSGLLVSGLCGEERFEGNRRTSPTNSPPRTQSVLEAIKE